MVENRPGAGTVIGTEVVERAAPDGDTVLLVANSFVINPPFKSANYDPSTNFEPVCYLAATPMVLVVQRLHRPTTLSPTSSPRRAPSPANSRWRAADPPPRCISPSRCCKRAANINVNYVPYPGTAPAVNALMGGHVTAVCADYPTVVSQLQAGSLRGLVTTSPMRASSRCRTCRPSPRPASASTRRTFSTASSRRRRHPPHTLAQLSGWFGTALKAPDMKPKLAKQGLFPVGTCGAEFGDYMRKQVDEYTRVIRELGIKAE